MFSVLLLCDVLEGSVAIGCARVHLADMRMGNGVVGKLYIKLLVAPGISDVHSRLEVQVHVPMVCMALPSGLLVYLNGAKPFEDAFLSAAHTYFLTPCLHRGYHTRGQNRRWR